MPIGAPGPHWFGFNLPASINGGGGHLPVRFRIEGEPKLLGIAAASWVVFEATVDSIYPYRPDMGPLREVSLVGHQFLRGGLGSSPPGNVFHVYWRRDFPVRPTRGRRYIVFLHRGWSVFHVAELSSDNLKSVMAGLARAEQRN